MLFREQAGRGAYLGYEGGDGHVCRQEDCQKGDVASDSCPPGQRHEVVPVVDIGQGCMSSLWLVPTG